MTTITDLPEEVLLIILERKCLKLEDVMNFKSALFKQLLEMLSYTSFWRNKFYLSCPTAKKKHTIEKQKEIYVKLNFIEDLEKSEMCIKTFMHYISLMTDEKVEDNNRTEMTHLLEMTSKKSIIYYLVLDKFNEIISAQSASCQIDSNLTYTYNVNRSLCNLKYCRFIYKLTNKYLNLPKEKQLLERLLIIIIQYFLPHVSYLFIETWINNLTMEILSHIKIKFPTHPIFTSLEMMHLCKENNIYDNFYNETEVTQIVQVLNEFFFQSGLKKLNDLLKELNLQERDIQFIELYFEKYLSRALFYIVARRLGICCDLIPWTFYVGLTWRLMDDGSIRSACTYGSCWSDEFYISLSVQVYSYRQYRTVEQEVLSRNHIRMIQMIMEDVWKRSTNDNNYERNSQVLSIFLSSWLKRETIKDIKAEYVDITKIESIPHLIKRLHLEERSKRIKFAVGMIVSHAYSSPCMGTRSEYHVGVIIGWHSRYDTIISKLLNMNNESNTSFLCCKEIFDHFRQPNYMILTERDRVCYVPQDFLSPCSPPRRINNIEIGRYFSTFEGTYYMPHPKLQEEYPDDVVFLKNL